MRKTIENRQNSIKNRTTKKQDSNKGHKNEIKQTNKIKREKENKKTS